MRIIAGEYRGVPLKAVPGRGTRPTSDKVKEALFSCIGPYFDGERVLDLYAGSGALGLEALSRGAGCLYAFERDRQALTTIAANCDKLKLELGEKIKLFPGDNHKALKRLRERESHLQFDLVFLDPPYAKQRLACELAQLEAEQWLADQAIVSCECSASDTLPEVVGSLVSFRDSVYGQTRLVLYQYRR